MLHKNKFSLRNKLHSCAICHWERERTCLSMYDCVDCMSTNLRLSTNSSDSKKASIPHLSRWPRGLHCMGFQERNTTIKHDWPKAEAFKHCLLWPIEWESVASVFSNFVPPHWNASTKMNTGLDTEITPHLFQDKSVTKNNTRPWWVARPTCNNGDLDRKSVV